MDNGDGRYTGTNGDTTFQFGSNGDFPITGNWNGGSVKCLGVYRPSTRQFFIDYNYNGTWNGTPADKMFTVGIAEDRPLAGDWDGNGIDQVGLYRSSVGWFYLNQTT